MTGLPAIACCAAVAGLAFMAGGSRLVSRSGFWLLLALVALGVVAGLFGRFGGGFGGSGGSGTGKEAATGPSAPAPQSQPDTRPKPIPRPLKITIDGMAYYVHGRKVTLEEIPAMLDKIPPGQGPAVDVIRADGSLPPAEIDLDKLLRDRNVSSHWPP